MIRLSRDRLIILFREMVFGIEDSLVSTVGLLSGVAASGVSTHTIITTGIILIMVEAFSMGAGTMLAENSAKEVSVHKIVPLTDSLLAGGTMLLSYILAGLVPLSPYVIVASRENAFTVSIIASVLALFLLGALEGKFARISMIRQGIQMAVVGGTAIFLGVMVGQLLK